MAYYKELMFFYYELYWEMLKASLIVQSMVFITIISMMYLADKVTSLDFLTLKSAFIFLVFALHSANILMLTMSVTKGLFSPLFLIIATMIYTALMKFLTGHFLPGLESLDQIIVLVFFAIYLNFVMWMYALFTDGLSDPTHYRTHDE